MGKIVLHTPKPPNDLEQRTEFEADDITQVESVSGAGDAYKGVNVYVRGLDGPQFCYETASDVKRLILESHTVGPVVIPEVHVVHHNGLSLWKSVAVGVFTSLVAAGLIWLFSRLF